MISFIKTNIVILSILFCTSLQAKDVVVPSPSEIYICRISKVVWTKKRLARIYFGRSSSGQGALLKPNTAMFSINEEDVIRYFKIEEPNVLWWNKQTTTFESSTSYLEINQGIRASWSGLHSHCFITWEKIDNELQLVVTGTDTFTSAGQKAEPFRQSTKIPK
jgi:hypothetical protein